MMRALVPPFKTLECSRPIQARLIFRLQDCRHVGRRRQAEGRNRRMVIGPATILQQIGEGGMGTVWMAQQTKTGQTPGRGSSSSKPGWTANKSSRPLKPSAGLASWNPNIARVLDGGTSDAADRISSWI